MDLKPFTIVFLLVFAATRVDTFFRSCGITLVPDDPQVVQGEDLRLTCAVNIPVGEESSCRPKSDKPFRIHYEYKPLPAGAVWQNSSVAYITLHNVSVAEDLKYIRCCYNCDGSPGPFDPAEQLSVDYPLALPGEPNCISKNNYDMECKWAFPYPYTHGLNVQINFTTEISSKCLPYTPGSVYSTQTAEPEEVSDKAFKVYKIYFPKYGSNNFLKYRTYCFLVKVKRGPNSLGPKMYEVKAGLDIIKPNEVEELNASPANIEPSRKLTVTWRPPEGMDGALGLAKGMVFEVSYHSNWNTDVETIQFTESVTKGSKTVTRVLEKLVPHTKYTIKVRGKLNIEANPHWSKPFTTTGNTESAVSETAPLLLPGGYSWIPCTDCRELRLYWRMIRPEDEFGVFRSYNLLHNNKEHVIEDRNTLYKDFRIEDNRNVFEIYLSNDVGPSNNRSTLVIENLENLPCSPTAVGVKVDQELSWSHIFWRPLSTKCLKGYALDGYAIYQCNKMETGSCKDSSYLTQVLPTVTEHQVNTSNTVGIATVVKYPDGTRAYSGIKWNCFYPETLGGGNFSFNSTVDVAAAPKVQITSKQYNSIMLQWSPLKCEDSRSWVKHYRVVYWDAYHCNNTQCQRVMNVSDWSDEVTVTLNDLEPNTQYMMLVSAITMNGPGVEWQDKLQTASIKLNVTVNRPSSDLNRVKISWDRYKSIRPHYVRAEVFDEQESHIKTRYYKLDQPLQRRVHEFDFNCSGYKLYSVRKFVKVTFLLVGDGNRQLSSDDQKYEMCMEIPLSEAAKLGVGLGVAVAVVLLIILGIYIYRTCRREVKVIKKTTTILVPESLVGEVKTCEDDDYLRDRRSSSGDGWPNPTNNNRLKSGKDSGHGTSTSSTLPLISPQVSLYDDVFHDESGRLRHNSGLKTTKLDVNDLNEANLDGYLGHDQLMRSDSYIDNEDIDITEMSEMKKPPPPSELGSLEYSKFGTNDIDELKQLDQKMNGMNYIAPELIVNHVSQALPQISSTQMAPRKPVMVNGIPTPNLDVVFENEIEPPEASLKFQTRPQGGSGGYVSRPPEKDSAASSLGYSKFADNSDPSNDSLLTEQNSQPIRSDNDGYLSHNAFPVTTKYYPDSGVEGSSGESVPRLIVQPERKRDSGYMSPESAGSFKFLKDKESSGSVSTDRLGSTSSHSSTEEGEECNKIPVPSATTDYVTVPQIKMMSPPNINNNQDVLSYI